MLYGLCIALHHTTRRYFSIELYIRCVVLDQNLVPTLAQLSDRYCNGLGWEQLQCSMHLVLLLSLGLLLYMTTF